MSDYTTTIDGPAQLTLVEEKRLKHTATVTDGSGAELIRFEPGKPNHQSVMIGDSSSVPSLTRRSVAISRSSSLARGQSGSA